MSPVKVRRSHCRVVNSRRLSALVDQQDDRIGALGLELRNQAHWPSPLRRRKCRPLTPDGSHEIAVPFSVMPMKPT